VDAYFGPDEWRPADDDARDTFPAEALRSRAGALIERLSKVDSGKFTGLERLRHAYLGKQLPAVRAKIDLLAGRQLVADYIERHSGTDKRAARRWQLFRTPLSTPQTPSGLAESLSE
jgi:hypothetical protein